MSGKQLHSVCERPAKENKGSDILQQLHLGEIYAEMQRVKTELHKLCAWQMGCASGRFRVPESQLTMVRTVGMLRHELYAMAR